MQTEVKDGFIYFKENGRIGVVEIPTFGKLTHLARKAIFIK
ncbi:hypothetical protein ACQVR4_06235 [Streptococcus pyogenes]